MRTTKTKKTRKHFKKRNARKRSPKGTAPKVKETAVQGPPVVEQEQEEADRQQQEMNRGFQDEETGPDQCLPPHDSDTETGLRKTEIDDEASVG